MLTNLEKPAEAAERGGQADQVLAETSPRARGPWFIPLVTPTSQTVGTRALNVLTGERYKTIAKENGRHSEKVSRGFSHPGAANAAEICGIWRP